MKIKTDYYGVFYKKSNGRWTTMPSHNSLLTKKDIIYDSCLENESEPFEKHLESYLKSVRKQYKKKIKLLRQVWES